MRLDRRRILQAGLLAAAWTGAHSIPVRAHAPESGDQLYDDAIRDGERSVRYPAGRAYWPFWIHVKPDMTSQGVRAVQAGEVIPLRAEVDGVMPRAYNNIWYRTREGFVPSSQVQPCLNNWNIPATRIRPGGEWAEVTVPQLIARDKPADDGAQIYALFSGCIVRVVARANDPRGWPWYQIADDKRREKIFVWAQQLRLLAGADFAPISPLVVNSFSR